MKIAARKSGVQGMSKSARMTGEENTVRTASMILQRPGPNPGPPRRARYHGAEGRRVERVLQPRADPRDHPPARVFDQPVEEVEKRNERESATSVSSEREARTRS
jgi:hypothetical protein